MRQHHQPYSGVVENNTLEISYGTWNLEFQVHARLSYQIGVELVCKTTACNDTGCPSQTLESQVQLTFGCNNNSHAAIIIIYIYIQVITIHCILYKSPFTNLCCLQSHWLNHDPSRFQIDVFGWGPVCAGYVKLKSILFYWFNHSIHMFVDQITIVHQGHLPFSRRVSPSLAFSSILKHRAWRPGYPRIHIKRGMFIAGCSLKRYIALINIHLWLSNGYLMVINQKIYRFWRNIWENLDAWDHVKGWLVFVEQKHRWNAASLG